MVSALTQGLRHLGFSNYAPKELMILENELEVGGKEELRVVKTIVMCG